MGPQSSLQLSCRVGRGKELFWAVKKLRKRGRGGGLVGLSIDREKGGETIPQCTRRAMTLSQLIILQCHAVVAPARSSAGVRLIVAAYAQGNVNFAPQKIESSFPFSAQDVRGRKASPLYHPRRSENRKPVDQFASRREEGGI